MGDSSSPDDPSVENPPPAIPSDLLDSSEPFDPGQWAIHGLLSTFFDHAGQDRPHHVQTIIDRIVREREKVAPSADSHRTREAPRRHGTRSFSRQLRLHRAALTSVAAAACLLLGFLLLWRATGGSRAFGADLREVGFQPPLLVVGLWADPSDQAAFRKAEQAVAEARRDLEAALSLDDPQVRPAWRPWSKLYRNLAAMGRWEDALAEAQKFVAYAEQQDESPDRYSPYYWSLTDLGNLYQMVGDYDNAQTCHQESLCVGRDYQEWFHRTGRFDDPRPHAFDAALACTLAPRCWALSLLSAAQGDQETAREFHNRADDLLTEFFEKDCAFRGLTPVRAPSASEGTVPSSASLYDLCMAVIAGSEPSPETMTFAVLVRQHLLHEAALLRLDQGALPPPARDLSDASAALEQAKTIPYYPHRDDFRQDFHIPMEALRINIARGNFAAALDAADEAEQHAGPRYRATPDQPSIGVLSRAELRFLRGVALAGLHFDDLHAPERGDALTLIESAIEAVKQAAATLPEAQRAQLLDRFAHWHNVPDLLRGGSLPDFEKEP